MDWDDGLLRLTAGGGTNASVLSYIDLSGYSTRNLVFGTSGTERIRVLSNGFVGIGTATPKEKLSVNGKIRVQEIKVETANWPDYVFDQDYKILGLTELESYIKENKHLPEMPSAKEVEVNGVALGEMNKLLLKKVEELTIHLIKQQNILIESQSILKSQQMEIDIH